jgi:hypothetical protein
MIPCAFIGTICSFHVVRVTLGLRRLGFVLVVAPHPIHDFSLVAAFRREVEEVVSTEQQVAAARTRRVGMEYLSVLMLVDDAEARQLVQLLLVFDRGIISSSCSSSAPSDCAA